MALYEIFTLSLHDALPIWGCTSGSPYTSEVEASRKRAFFALATPRDRKSTRLNSSHVSISYAVFCLKKKIPKSTSNLFNHFIQHQNLDENIAIGIYSMKYT